VGSPLAFGMCPFPSVVSVVTWIRASSCDLDSGFIFTENFSSELLIHEQENGSGEKILVAFDSASAGPSDAIEGYVPQGEQQHLHLQLPADKSISKSPKKKGMSNFTD